MVGFHRGRDEVGRKQTANGRGVFPGGVEEEGVVEKRADILDKPLK